MNICIKLKEYRRFIPVIHILLAVVSGSLVPDTYVQAAEEKVTLNFVNADIEEVIKAISHITGKNFVVDPRVKGTINIISATPVASSLAYDILLSTLRMQGFAAVETGGITKILPEADAKLYVSNVHDKVSGEKIITRVFALQYESASQLVPVLRPLIPPNNIIVAYPSNNTLVVTDYASNISRIEQIVSAIDQPNKMEPIIIPVKLASAVELAQTINRMMQDSGGGTTAGGGDSSQRYILLADSRTNSLLLRSDNPEKMTRIQELVKKLDVETGALGNMHVVYLKNAEAVKLAHTLSSILSGDTSSVNNTSSTSSNASPFSSSSSSTSTGQTTFSATTNSGTSAVSGGGVIQADAATNSLIITAPTNVFNNLRAVIDKLDVRRAQIFVEALIAEVSASKDAEFGVQWQGITNVDNAGNQVAGGTNFGTGGNNIINLAEGIKSGTPTFGQGLNFGIVAGGGLGVLVRAMQTDSSTNILSTPNLVMLDNEEAKIVIGQNVPFITGSQQSSTANSNPFQTIERKDVGLTLKIKPQISESGTIKMVIYQEVSSVQDTTNSAGIITNKRTLETSVLVNDNQILVLGGLIQDQVNKSEYKVPLLGDIPLIGWLFRYDTSTSSKTNLMIFIKPKILRTAEASNVLTEDRYKYLQDQEDLSQLPQHKILPSMQAPRLPDKNEGAAFGNKMTGTAGSRVEGIKPERAPTLIPAMGTSSLP